MKYFNPSIDDPNLDAYLAERYGHDYDFAQTREGNDEAVERLKLILTPCKDIELGNAGSWLIKGLVPDVGTGIFFGPTGTAKTFACIDMGFIIARGQKWLGKKVLPGAVIYIGLEGQGGLNRRVVAYKQHHQLEGEDIPFALLDYRLEICNPASVEVLINHLRLVEGHHLHQPVRQVIIDTLSQSMVGFKENTDDMAIACGHMEQIAAELGCFVLAVHHTGKEEDRGPRGHSSIAANTSFMARTSGNKEQGFKLSAEK